MGECEGTLMKHRVMNTLDVAQMPQLMSSRLCASEVSQDDTPFGTLDVSAAVDSAALELLPNVSLVSVFWYES